MHLFPPILAVNDDATGKVIIALIAGVIWAIGSIVSSLNKKAEEEKSRQSSGRFPTDVVPPMELQPLAPALQPPRRAMPPSLPSSSRPVTGPNQLKRKTATEGSIFSRPRRKTSPGVAAPVPLKSVKAVAPPAPPSAAPARRSRTASPAAPRIAGLLPPELLRSQIIVAEVLGKPLALRDNDHF